MQGERDYIHYQEYLAHRRDELAMDLGTAAVTLISGGAINERPSFTPQPEIIRPVEVPVETRRPLGGLALSQELRQTPTTPNLATPQVYTGYAA